MIGTADVEFLGDPSMGAPSTARSSIAEVASLSFGVRARHLVDSRKIRSGPSAATAGAKTAEAAMKVTVS